MPISLRTRVLLAIASGAAIVAPLSAINAHDEHAQGIYKVRHENYEKLGDAFKTINDQTKASTPNLAAIRTAAQVVNDASVNQFKWFPAGSGPEGNPKTRAKAEIWSKPQEFEKAQQLFASEATKLTAAVAGNDVSAIRAQFGATGKACKNCHDSFRAPEKD